jgi:hypothetical protein
MIAHFPNSCIVAAIAPPEAQQVHDRKRVRRVLGSAAAASFD